MRQTCNSHWPRHILNFVNALYVRHVLRIPALWVLKKTIPIFFFWIGIGSSHATVSFKDIFSLQDPVSESVDQTELSQFFLSRQNWIIVRYCPFKDIFLFIGSCVRKCQLSWRTRLAGSESCPPSTGRPSPPLSSHHS